MFGRRERREEGRRGILPKEREREREREGGGALFLCFLVSLFCCVLCERKEKRAKSFPSPLLFGKREKLKGRWRFC